MGLNNISFFGNFWYKNSKNGFKMKKTTNSPFFRTSGFYFRDLSAKAVSGGY